MSVRSFHSVFMATAVAGAALGCYLVSLRVASERAALEQVERQIVQTQRNIRLVQTEIGTRARLAQLERWNVRVLALSAPTADQILGDKFQLASLVAPERRPAVEAPVVLASAPAPAPVQPLADAGPAPALPLLHEASLKLPERAQAPARRIEPAAKKPEPVLVKEKAKPVIAVASAEPKKVEKKAKTEPVPAKPVLTAKADPLAPLPAGSAAGKGSRTQK